MRIFRDFLASYKTQTIEVMQQVTSGPAGVREAHIQELQQSNWLDFRIALHTLAATRKPRKYLEVGVWCGWSMAQVVCASPMTVCVGIDQWCPNYAGYPTSSEEQVFSALRKIKPNPSAMLYTGDSREILTTVCKQQGPFDLILVDGDHSHSGAFLTSTRPSPT
jgi:predicted O-methyltransferase YrrM